MREIKFRAWDAQEKKMLYHDDTCGDTARFFEELKYIHDGYGRMNLMQFTGLKDKNGKEIFEGDIIEFGISVRRIFEVVFNEWAFKARIGKGEFSSYEEPMKYCEVLGNIYQNPDLLK